MIRCCLSTSALFSCGYLSRNARLSAEARLKAPAIYRALQWAQGAVSSGQHSETSELQAHVAKEIEEAGGKIDYIEVRFVFSCSHKYGALSSRGASCRLDVYVKMRACYDAPSIVFLACSLLTLRAWGPSLMLPSNLLCWPLRRISLQRMGREQCASLTTWCWGNDNCHNASLLV